MTYEEKKQMLTQNRIEREEKERVDFLNSVNVVYGNDIINPIRHILKEKENCYMSFCIVKYALNSRYTITRHKKDFPFSIYYEKNYFKGEIPNKYMSNFEDLEKEF